MLVVRIFVPEKGGEPLSEPDCLAFTLCGQRQVGHAGVLAGNGPSGPAMPDGLRAHIRYPDELYRVQTALYATYHMDAPEDFYHREDQWQIPAVAEREGTVPFMVGFSLGDRVYSRVTRS